MEITLYILLTLVSCFYTYLSFSKTVDQTDWNKTMAGLCWFCAGVNSLVIRYYIPNSSGLTKMTDNGNYWNIMLGVLFTCIGISIWLQMVLDRMTEKQEGMM
jgi:hypothetical protein